MSKIWGSGNFRVAAHSNQKLQTYLPGFQYSLSGRAGIPGEGQDYFIEWLVPLSGVMYRMIFTPAAFTAVSAITRPMAAGEPAMNPKACPGFAPKAFCSTCPALAE